MDIRAVLNNIKWNPSLKRKEYIIRFIHRGGVKNVKEVRFERIKQITKSYFTYLNNIGEEIIIPYHRILDIIDVSNNRKVWSRRRVGNY
ncbi:MAG: DUF504 domain-containing protein [Candidatus Odinarchaeia archaeon]